MLLFLVSKLWRILSNLIVLQEDLGIHGDKQASFQEVSVSVQDRKFLGYDCFPDISGALYIKTSRILGYQKETLWFEEKCVDLLIISIFFYVYQICEIEIVILV